MSPMLSVCRLDGQITHDISVMLGNPSVVGDGLLSNHEITESLSAYRQTGWSPGYVESCPELNGI